MHNINYKHLLYIGTLFFLVTIAGLWSWNTLSELFTLPHAQYKHALAAFCILFILKWALASSHLDGICIHGKNHDQKNH